MKGSGGPELAAKEKGVLKENSWSSFRLLPLEGR